MGLISELMKSLAWERKFGKSQKWSWTFLDRLGLLWGQRTWYSSSWECWEWFARQNKNFKILQDILVIFRDVLRTKSRNWDKIIKNHQKSGFAPKSHEIWRPWWLKIKLISENKSRRSKIFEKSIFYCPEVLRKNCLTLRKCLRAMGGPQ